MMNLVRCAGWKHVGYTFCGFSFPQYNCEKKTALLTSGFLMTFIIHSLSSRPSHHGSGRSTAVGRQTIFLLTKGRSKGGLHLKGQYIELFYVYV